MVGARSEANGIDYKTVPVPRPYLGTGTAGYGTGSRYGQVHQLIYMFIIFGLQ